MGRGYIKILKFKRRAKLFSKLKRKKGSARKTTRYKTIDDVFYDFYNGHGIEHSTHYNTSFSVGEVVTTKCGFDLGIVATDCDSEFPTVYGRFAKHQILDFVPPTYGGETNWYKTGIKVSMNDWKSMCRRYWD